MPGLVGFCKPDSSAVGARSALDRMARALETESRFQVALHSEPGVGLGRVGLPNQESAASLVWNEDETVCVVMEGELYDDAPLRASLDGERLRTTAQAELVLRLYERFGEACAEKLNGSFAFAIWDRRTRTLLVVNDRLGLFPIYYAQAAGGVLFGSGVRALLADPGLSRQVDKVAVGQFVVYDHMLGDRTLLAAARLLPQGTVMTVRDGALRIRPYWTLRYPEVYRPLAEADYVEQFLHHLRQAVARQKPDARPTAMLLSGGLDSRLLLGLLHEGGAQVRTLTFGIPGCDDARVASEVASAVGASHRFVELKPDWLAGLADEAVRLTDGLANVVNLHVLAPLEAESQFAQVLYKGFMGDALFGFALKRQMWGDYDSETRYRVHLGAHTEQGVVNYDDRQRAGLFTEAFKGAIGDAIGQTYRDGMERSGASQLANQRLYFDLTQRVPRMTLNGVEAARSRAVVRLPFCDNDLLDFALTVPPGFQFERYLPKAALTRHYPRLAQIPMAGTGRPLSVCARDIAVQAKTLVSWHLRRAGLGWMAARERRPYKDYDRWFRTILRPWVESILLQPRALERGYFEPDYVRRIAAEHAAGANHAVRLGALLTLELWHRQFLD
jgi:asparagine synthase (glutamine-hydrolysing)